MMLNISPFFFKRRPYLGPQQLSFTIAQVEAPGPGTAEITALYALNGDKTNSDPETLTLYGTWSHAAGTFTAHGSTLTANGFDEYLAGAGIQEDDWGVGSLDTYYNTDGLTVSFLGALQNTTANTRIFQYVQADLEYVDVYLVNTTTIRLAACLGTGTEVTQDVLIADTPFGDGLFHHIVVTFHPSGSRIARLYIDDVLEAETAAVSGIAVFGDEASDIRRGIGFGCSYTAANTNPMGNVDHCVLIRGLTPPSLIHPDAMLYNDSPMLYNDDQLTYSV